MEERNVYTFFVCLTILATCSTVLAESNSATEENSSHNYRRINSKRHNGTISLSSLNDNSETITSHPGRKVSHMSTGGHSITQETKRDKSDILWDDGLLMSSSSANRKEKKSNERNNDDDDDKKTLSQQVKEGKYGLIQNEIYSEEPKRPGIISYMANPDMPKDNIKNLGGLDEDEIWLAENHVLVLRGGKLPERDTEDEIEQDIKWPPIDDYQAPRRQVKIPLKPKIPPPFPVQLTDDGPIELIGANGKSGRSGENETDLPFSRGFFPGEGPFFPVFTNVSAPLTSALSFIPVNSSKGTIQFKPIVIPDKITKLNPQSRDEDSSPGPFYPALPPGAVIVPPPTNRSDYDDEEDQSIYYPPPYSFVYQRENNSTVIPPGPLVPGIILPPPPDFFSTLDEKKPTTIKDKYTKRIGPTIAAASRSPHTDYFPRKSSTKAYKSSLTTISSSPETTTQKTKTSSSRSSTFSRYNPKTTLRKPIVSNSTQSFRNEKKPAPYIPRTVFLEITTPSSIKPAPFELEPVINNQVSETSTEKERWSAVVSSKAVPLLAAYYATTTPPTSVEQPIKTTPATVKSSRHQSRLPDQTSYFFYGEPNNEATSSSGASEDSTVYYGRTTTESSTSYYELEESLPQRQEEQYYNRVEDPQIPPRQQTAIKLLESFIKDPHVYQYAEPISKDRTPTYYPPSTRNSYLTATPKPQTNAYYQDVKFDYEQKRKPKPIYQYSFESTDYVKQDRRLSKKKKQQQSEREFSYEYQDEDIIQNVSEPQFHYESGDSVSEQQVQTNRLPYKSEQPVKYFAATTARSPVELSSTLEPHRAYFTKQDEQLLDDVTKEYFTMFGKKLTGKRVQSTTPIYGKVGGVTEKPKYATTYGGQTSRYKAPKVKVHYGGQTRQSYSLDSDTLVNYKRPLSLINPDSEFITVIDPYAASVSSSTDRPHIEKLIQQSVVRPVLQSDNQVRDYPRQQSVNLRHERIIQQAQHQQDQNDFIPMEGPRSLGQRPQYPTRPISLESDIAVNYQNPRPPINPDAEFIRPISGQTVSGHREKANSYFAYSLPGDGGHFYFLTPQAITQRQGANGGYLYPNPRGSRLLRRRRGPVSV